MLFSARPVLWGADGPAERLLATRPSDAMALGRCALILGPKIQRPGLGPGAQIYSFETVSDLQLKALSNQGRFQTRFWPQP